MTEAGEANCLAVSGVLTDGNNGKLLTDKGPETTNSMSTLQSV